MMGGSYHPQLIEMHGPYHFKNNFISAECGIFFLPADNGRSFGILGWSNLVFGGVMRPGTVRMNVRWFSLSLLPPKLSSIVLEWQ